MWSPPPRPDFFAKYRALFVPSPQSPRLSRFTAGARNRPTLSSMFASSMTRAVRLSPCQKLALARFTAAPAASPCSNLPTTLPGEYKQTVWQNSSAEEPSSVEVGVSGLPAPVSSTVLWLALAASWCRCSSLRAREDAWRNSTRETDADAGQGRAYMQPADAGVLNPNLAVMLPLGAPFWRVEMKPCTA